MSQPPAASPVELKPERARRWPEWLRGLLAGGAPKARVVAPREVRLGQAIEVEWGVDCPASNLSHVAVSLVGSEIARQRLSSRTGITIVAESSAFEIVEIARAMPTLGVRVAYGRASIVVPAASVPSVPGRHNEIGWAIVVEAAFRPSPGGEDPEPLRESFPIVVRPEAA